MVEERKCAFCGESFTTHNHLRKYCSRECYEESSRQRLKARSRQKHNVPETRTCKQCGKIFDTRYKTLFCSDKCRSAYKKRYYKPKEPRTATCPICGKTFTTKTPNKIYCSDECRLSRYRKLSPVVVAKTKEPPPDRPLTADTEKLVCIWYRKGDSVQKIAQVLNRRVEVIEDILKRNGDI